METIDSKKTLPQTFSKNLSQLVEHDKNRDASIPLHLKFINQTLKFFGSFWFLIGNVFIFCVWLALNIPYFNLVKPFDPYPFQFLTLWASLEAIVLSVVVLISQNKLQIDSEERAHLNLHINLLAESETTFILKKLERIEKHFQLHADEAEQKQVKDLIVETRPEQLAEFIHDTFKEDPSVEPKITTL